MKTSHQISNILVLICFSLFYCFSYAFSGELPKTLSAESAYQMQQAGDLVIIDIRSPDEWQETGVAKGAKLITMHNPEGPLAFLSQITKAVSGDKNSPVAVICASGSRSNWAQGFLTANGFHNVTNISEGMMGRGPSPGWLARKLPIQQP